MAANRPATEERLAQIARLFPEGVPKLWCPPLTHYRADGTLDRLRMTKHLQYMAPYVRGLLVPGSTGDGWEMDDDEQRDVLDLVLEIAAESRIHVLVGALRTDAEAERRAIVHTVERLKQRAGTDNASEAMAVAGVCGFTVCPPAGSDLSQQEIHDRLAAILELGLPTALYQLPQVTGNEMHPATVAELAGEFANFYLFKDSSGQDRVATSGLDFGGVCFVRGAEGDYGRWLDAAGGPYGAFLLSTANCFAPQLHQMIEHLESGRVEEARAVIGPVQEAVARMFPLVADLPDGNAFTNANKAVDHFLAHGPKALEIPPPRLHAGSRLPSEIMDATARTLTDCGLMPGRGYLET